MIRRFQGARDPSSRFATTGLAWGKAWIQYCRACRDLRREVVEVPRSRVAGNPTSIRCCPCAEGRPYIRSMGSRSGVLKTAAVALVCALVVLAAAVADRAERVVQIDLQCVEEGCRVVVEGASVFWPAAPRAEFRLYAPRVARGTRVASSAIDAGGFAVSTGNPGRIRHFGRSDTRASGPCADLWPGERRQRVLRVGGGGVQHRARISRLWAKTVAPTVET